VIARRGAAIRPRVLNAPIALLVGRLGLPIPGVRMLRVHGRRTGRLRSVPVLLLRAGGRRYLVAPRGRTDWSRNLAAAGWGELIRGRSVERVAAEAVAGEERERAIGAYLRRYGRLTHRLFDVERRPDEATIREIAPRHPVFRLTERPPGP
jgi:deazaflavin-dependent oxidoreductase (nitroreductase family)